MLMLGGNAKCVLLLPALDVTMLVRAGVSKKGSHSPILARPRGGKARVRIAITQTNQGEPRQ